MFKRKTIAIEVNFLFCIRFLFNQTSFEQFSSWCVGGGGYWIFQKEPIVPKSYGFEKQAGTGPSRRHIQGSKIAKRLPSVKYSFTVLENRKFFEKKNFEKITYSKKWTEWRAEVSQCRKTERGTL